MTSFVWAPMSLRVVRAILYLVRGRNKAAACASARGAGGRRRRGRVALTDARCPNNHPTHTCVRAPLLVGLGYLRAPDRLCLFVTRHTYSLRKHLLKLADNGQRLTRGQVGYIGQQVVGGLKFLHHQGVLHRDLKVSCHELALLRATRVTRATKT